MHHDLWDMDPSAAPQLTTIRHNGRNRDVVVVTAKTGWLYVFDRVTGEPIWPIEERPVPKSEMEGEQSWPTQPYPTNPPPYIKHTFGVDDISPHLSAGGARDVQKRLAAADNKGIFTPISMRDTVHVPASNGGTLFGGAASEPRSGAVYVVAHDNPGIVRLLRPGEGRGGGGAPALPPGRPSTSRTVSRVTGPIERVCRTSASRSRSSCRRSGEQHRRRNAALRRRRNPRRSSRAARVACLPFRTSAARISITW